MVKLRLMIQKPLYISKKFVIITMHSFPDAEYGGAAHMEKQKKVKFYQTQTFRALVAIALAAALLATSAMENTSSLFAPRQNSVLGVEDCAAPD